jgi:hypothetical protein
VGGVADRLLLDLATVAAFVLAHPSHWIDRWTVHQRLTHNPACILDAGLVHILVADWVRNQAPVVAQNAEGIGGTGGTAARLMVADTRRVQIAHQSHTGH